MVLAYSRCFSVKLRSGFSANSLDRISMLFSGVLNSCDMLARNSDLYFDDSDSCSAFSSSDCPGEFDLVVLVFNFPILVGELMCLSLRVLRWFCFNSSCCSRSRSSDSCRVRACSCRRVFVSVNSACRLVNSLGQRLGLLQQFLSAHRGGDRVQHDPDDFGELIEESEMDLGKSLERGQLDYRFDIALEQHRHDNDVHGSSFAEAGADLDVVRWSLRDENALSSRRQPGRPDLRAAGNDPTGACVRDRRSLRAASKFRFAILGFVDVKHTMLYRNQGRQFGQNDGRYRETDRAGPAGAA